MYINKVNFWKMKTSEIFSQRYRKLLFSSVIFIISSVCYTPLCKLIETNEYKLSNNSPLFYLVVGYKTSHVGTLVTNMIS